jgi:hypothetical protein
MVLVCLRGAELVFQRLRTELRNVVFGALIAAILVAQTVPRIEQFSSPFNWYHLKMPGDPTIMNQPF